MAHPLELERSLEWSDAFSVGHAVLDAEHRGLMASINNFRTAQSQDDVERRWMLFQSLVLLAEHHFDHEDAVLRKIVEGGPEISEEAKSVSETAIREHISAHGVALAQLRAMGHSIESRTTSEPPAFYNSLKAWFVDHAINHDSYLKTVFQAL
jgi:hemerythrin-like metal-binding protein